MRQTVVPVRADRVMMEYCFYKFLITFAGDSVIKITYMDGVNIPLDTFLGKKIANIANRQRERYQI